ncbi:hypothetical protein EO244_05515 [Ancylomarina salipaludis]|uniref:Uncharacterized protein n=1 Tax=Ancylomarina salipaludis TaxID=2501299 RepID=A0A4Q1JQ45_9BACT|nr:hypothetical protein [Ancylomarina salipaludis]RXQ96290.1 hypothetical protein EO244_05515 [Ancylomarina salipaludis]
MGYEIFEPQVKAPLHTLARAEAKRHFNLHLSSIGERIKELEKLMNSVNIELDFTIDSIVKIDNWFPDIIEPNPQKNNEPNGKSFSICNDLGMYLGEILKKESEWIKWELNTLRKSDISYHRPVLTNFRGVKNKNYYIDFDLVLCQYAHRIIDGKVELGTIKRMIEYAIEKSN